MAFESAAGDAYFDSRVVYNIFVNCAASCADDGSSLRTDSKSSSSKNASSSEGDIKEFLIN